MAAEGYDRVLKDRRRASEAQARFEALLERDPEAYRRKVGRWIALGVVYYLLLVLIALGIVGGLFAVWQARGRVDFRLILFAAFFLWAVLSALFLRLPPLEGREVPRGEFPALWTMVDEIVAALDAPRIDRLLLDLDNNASAAQVTRFLFSPGPAENVLTLGLPYLLATSPDEARATVAHELGHFAGSHSRFSIRAYRFAMALSAVSDKVGEGGLTRWTVVPFLNWYGPRVDALLAPLRRRHEFEADAAATRLGLGAANRSDLLRMSVVSPWFYRRFVPRWMPEAARQREVAPFLIRLAETLAQPLDEDEARRALEKSIAHRTTPGESHPALSERLAPFAAPPSLDDLPGAVAPRVPNAADAFLGPGSIEAVSPGLLESLGISNESVSEIEAVVEPPPTAFEAAATTLSEKGLREAADALVALARDPAVPLLERYYAAVTLLREEHPEGLALVQAFRRDPSVGPDAQIALLNDAAQRGDEEAERAELAAIEATKAEIDAIAKGIASRDRRLTFTPAEIPDDVLQVYLDQLRPVEAVRSVHVIGAALPGVRGYAVLIVRVGVKSQGFRIPFSEPEAIATELYDRIGGPSGVCLAITAKPKFAAHYTDRPEARLVWEDV